MDRLSPELRAFSEFFEIDADVIALAAESSLPRENIDDHVERWVALLPDAERAEWLVRLAQGELHLDVQFLCRLREIGDR